MYTNSWDVRICLSQEEPHHRYYNTGTSHVTTGSTAATTAYTSAAPALVAIGSYGMVQPPLVRPIIPYSAHSCYLLEGIRRVLLKQDDPLS